MYALGWGFGNGFLMGDGDGNFVNYSFCVSETLWFACLHPSMGIHIDWYIKLNETISIISS